MKFAGNDHFSQAATFKKKNRVAIKLAVTKHWPLKSYWNVTMKIGVASISKQIFGCNAKRAISIWIF